MIFEFVTYPDFNFVTSFAKKLNLPVYDNRLTIPASLGTGYIQYIGLEPGFRVIIHRYNLKEELVLKRISPPNTNDIISLIFNNNEEFANFSPNGQNQIQFSKNTDAAIQVASIDLDSVNSFPANSNIHYIVVVIKASLLSGLLNTQKHDSIIQTIINGSSSFLFYERMTADIEKALLHLTDANEENDLSTFYYKIKIYELLYLLFEKLLQRKPGLHSPVNKADIEKLFIIRNAVLADLSKHPSLQELSRISGLSLTKMKALFKQVFGDSIYNFYQKARMEEAAFLIHHARHSVSETGYHLGFSNLSHFSRLFQKHIGITPKKYALGR